MRFEELSQNFEKNTSILLPYSKCNIFIKKQLLGLSEDNIIHIKSEILYYYYELEWGLKLVARNVFGISYSECRALFKHLGFSFRVGNNIVTDNIKQFRRQKAIHETKNNIGFADKDLKRFATKTNRGVQGYYYNNSTKEYVWLRSTYEYIYAKFLNKIGINWKIEQFQFNLSDGTKYTPDFYIYTETWELKQIVEIKGYFDCRSYKVGLLNLEYYTNTDIEIILINDITKYIPNGQTYLSELKTWKQIRKLKDQKLKELML